MGRPAACGQVMALVVAAMIASTSSPSFAQEGPLAAPLAPGDATAAAAAAKPTKPKKAKPRPRYVKGQDAPAPDTASAAKPLPTASAGHNVPTANDPLSFGLKWNGANDSAERTRVQNYNGDAAGTGASVGLNLHF